MTEDVQQQATRRRSGWRAVMSPLNAARLVVFAVFLLAWEIGSNSFNAAFWISSPSSIFDALIRWYESGSLISDTRTTLIEAGSGFLLGAMAGALIGFFFGWIRSLGDLLEPFVLAIYTLPKVALAPLFVLWFGIGLLNKVMFSALLVFFMVFFTTFQGARQVDREFVMNARIMGASRVQTWTTIAVPYSAVWVFTGLRIGLPYALIGAIVAEFVASSEGVGYRIKEATAFFDTASVFAGLIVLMMISSTLLFTLRMIERRVLRWQDPEPASVTVSGELQQN